MKSLGRLVVCWFVVVVVVVVVGFGFQGQLAVRLPSGRTLCWGRVSSGWGEKRSFGRGLEEVWQRSRMTLWAVAKVVRMLRKEKGGSAGRSEECSRCKDGEQLGVCRSGRKRYRRIVLVGNPARLGRMESCRYTESQNARVLERQSLSPVRD